VDSLRGIAALYVVIKHCRGILFAGLNALTAIHPRATWTLFDYATLMPLIASRLGREFVIFFFVLSGFSIAHSLRNKPDIPGFYLRRIIRLYPPYVFALAWAAIVFLAFYFAFPQWYSGPLPGDTSDNGLFIKGLYQSRDFLSIPTLLSNLLYMPKGAFIIQFWSLTYEVLFYLLVPFFLCNKPIYFLVSLLLYTGILFDTAHLVPGNIITKFAFEFNFYFAIGVFCYSYWPRIQKLLFFPVPWFIALSSILFLSMLALNMKLGHITRYSSLVSALLSCVLLANFLGHNIRIKPLMWVGKFSYTLYITHVATIYCMLFFLYRFTPIHLPIYSRWLWLAGIPISVLVGYGSYLLVEKQTKVILDKLRK
jgi:peptidoglycan/LPS O-acetylase OafA/YrhL